MDMALCLDGIEDFDNAGMSEGPELANSIFCERCPAIVCGNVEAEHAASGIVALNDT